MCESESVLPVSQPDMTLSDQELFGDDHPHDHCGVFGVWAPGEDVSRLTYFSLYALQHRGQQSAGIATSNGKQILVYKDQGLVSQVFSEQSLQGLRGHIALGHVRYATTGADVWRNAQPTLGPTPTGTLALAHNGNLTNTVELRELASEIADDGEDFERGASTDTSLVTALLGMADRIPGPTPFIASPSVTPSETDGDEAAPASAEEEASPVAFSAAASCANSHARCRASSSSAAFAVRASAALVSARWRASPPPLQNRHAAAKNAAHIFPFICLSPFSRFPKQSFMVVYAFKACPCTPFPLRRTSFVTLFRQNHILYVCRCDHRPSRAQIAAL